MLAHLNSARSDYKVSWRGELSDPDFRCESSISLPFTFHQAAGVDDGDDDDGDDDDDDDDDDDSNYERRGHMLSSRDCAEEVFSQTFSSLNSWFLSQNIPPFYLFVFLSEESIFLLWVYWLPAYSIFIHRILFREQTRNLSHKL